MSDWRNILTRAVVIFLGAMLLLAVGRFVVERTSILTILLGAVDAASSSAAVCSSCGTVPRAPTETVL